MKLRKHGPAEMKSSPGRLVFLSLIEGLAVVAVFVVQAFPQENYIT